jgi:hypothetical protein
MHSPSHVLALLTVNISLRCEDYKPHEPQCAVFSKFLCHKYFSQSPIKKRPAMFSISNVIDQVLPRRHKRLIIIIVSLISIFLLQAVGKIGNACERTFFFSFNVCNFYFDSANISLLSNYSEISLIYVPLQTAIFMRLI